MAHPQEMEVEGTQGGEEVSRDPSVDLLLGQYALKFRDTVEDLPGNLEVLTTSIAKATDWVLRAAHHNLLTIDGGDAFVAQMTSFVNAVMVTDFSRIRGPGELDNFSLTSLLEAEMSSKDKLTIHPAPVFRPPPPAACGPLDEGVADVGAPPDVLMQALDNLGRPASPPRIPASKKRKGVDRPVPPPPPQKSKVAYSCPGLPLPINRTTKPKPRPTTWAGIAQQAAPMPPPPPGLGPQLRPHPEAGSRVARGYPPDLTKFFTESAVRAANGYLRDGQSMLKVTSIVHAYDGLSLVTPAVASSSDLDILCNFIRESLPTGTPFEVALPSSTSFIKILDVPYFDLKGLKITQEALEKALRTSVHAEVFAYLSTKPRIDRNSAHLTSCTVYCNIWDSQQGTRTKKALGQLIFLAGRSCAIRPAAVKQLSCPICSGPHEQKEHRQHAGCCKGNAKAKPPVPPTPRDQPCPHKGRCVNCHKDHAANSASCKFWAHRYDREWIMAEYRQTNVGKPSGSKYMEGDEVIGAPKHPDWLQMVHIKEGEVPRVLAYVSTRLSRYRPTMRRDIVNHRDILVLSLFSRGEVLNLMNVYSDDQHTAIEHLAASVHSLPPFIYMAGDFNCVSMKWDDYEHGESSTAISLRDTASQISLEWARPSNHGPMRISPNPNQRSNVLDLVFLAPSEILILMPRLEHTLQGPSDHVPICTDLDIGPEPPGSGEAEKSFISDILRDLAAIPVAAPATKEGVEALADAIATVFLDAWLAHSTESKPTKRSKSWWTEECSETFGVYQLSRSLADYNKFKKACKDAKRDFFDERITEIATSRKRPWVLMEWPCHDMDDLWNTLHGTYNAASGREYDASVLDELPDEPVCEWADFLEHELLSALKGCSNSSAPGPDHVTWVHLKELLKDKHVLALFIVLANACLRVGHWPRIFKELLSVIIPKLNKPSYAIPKAFRPIVLLITFSKLIEKMIANRIQFDAVKHDIFHPNQLGGICQRSTEDAALILTHLVRAGWVKGLQTSALAFDIVQFFPSINHEMFMAVLRKQGFSPVLVEFFAAYLIGRSTIYCWNTFQSDLRSADVGVGQGSALLPVISGLFIAPVMKLFYIKAAPLNTMLLSFVDDRTILAQSKQLDDNNVGLHAYNPSLDLGYAPHTGATPLKPKTYWRYLGFYFDRGLTFHEHVRYYATKAFTTVQAMRMLGNSTRGLSPKQRRLLYSPCVVPIATYGYRLWYFDGTCNKGSMNQLKRMQRKAALWITGAFRTSPTGGLEALAGLIPIHLMLKKLATRAVYRVATLSDTHPLRSMMGEGLLKRAAPHARSAALMTPAMQGKVKSTVMEVDKCVHTLTESFECFAPKARPGDRLLDHYADRLHFDERDPTQDRRPYLDELIARARADPLTVLAATDGSVPQSNQYQAALAAIIYKGHRELDRTHYVSGRVTAPDAELNAILCAVRLAVKQANCQHIMVFTDSMGSAHRAVDPGVHSGQAFSLSVCRALQEWFEADDLCRITFIYVPSALQWDIHGVAHKYVTKLKVRVEHRKTDNSIDALRSRAAHSVLDSWGSTFQDPTYRGSEFLELQQPDGRPLQPSYLSGGPWLSTFGHSVTEFACICRCITGHVPIGAYYHRFKINEPHGCTCGAALQSHQHILFRCHDRYSVHDPRFLGDIASFMKYNPTVFGFNRDPSGVG
ncbi:unnamed protein product [Cyclocybe aegerita]|uniref:Reverse transcriptase domain-containing protein n=1 Tax=Cyclocybe aegerita TaxID=1973307 RepID=A0A8S0X521_CYCAE|nr:unnamed protein product [Cyclocybe aegerita]